MLKKKFADDKPHEAAEALIKYCVPVANQDYLSICQTIARDVFVRKLTDYYDGIKQVFLKVT